MVIVDCFMPSCIFSSLLCVTFNMQTISYRCTLSCEYQPGSGITSGRQQSTFEFWSTNSLSHFDHEQHCRAYIKIDEVKPR